MSPGTRNNPRSDYCNTGRVDKLAGGKKPWGKSKQQMRQHWDQVDSWG